MDFTSGELTLTEQKKETVSSWFRFLFSAVDENEEIAYRFLSDFDSILTRCAPPSQLNLYTTADYRETLVVEKLQRFYVICSHDLIPTLDRFAGKYSAIEVTQPSPVSLLLIVGTRRPS